MALTILPNLHHVLRLYLRSAGDDAAEKAGEAGVCGADEGLPRYRPVPVHPVQGPTAFAGAQAGTQAMA
ncbi:hypothetical protein EWM60_18855 [Candidatus Erwinia dacicola]|nr:hypothetical protein [Candidatus Erwinia dacicola]